MHTLANIRKFETKHFMVIVDAIVEQDLDISYDETSETQDKLDSGQWVAFCASARVIHKATGIELASDYLGNCIYSSYREFRYGGCCSDMVHTVCDEARKELVRLADTHIRRIK